MLLKVRSYLYNQFVQLRANKGGFPGALLVNNPPANAGNARDKGSIPGSGRSPGGGRGNPLQ